MNHFPRVQEAILFAAERHAGTDRDGEAPLPYVAHPVEVLSSLRHLGGVTDEDLLVAAALHDTIEDTETTREEIAARFGERAAGFVQALTRREPTEAERAGLSKDEVWAMRSELLLREIAAMPREVLPVKLADRLSNVREAKRTKTARKVERYLGQTRRILEIVPRGVAPELWDAIRAEV